MTIEDQVKSLYGSGTKENHVILRRLEKISGESSLLYLYLPEFIDMIRGELPMLGIRGFRLLCKQAK